MTFELDLYHLDSPCRQPDANPENWFPDHHVTEAHAMKLCAGCPIMDACRDYAKRHRLGGIWGGHYFTHPRGKIWGSRVFM